MYKITITGPDGKRQTVKAEQFFLSASTDDDLPSSPNKSVYSCNGLFMARTVGQMELELKNQ